MKHHNLQYKMSTGLHCITCGIHARHTKSGLIIYRVKSADGATHRIGDATEDCDFEFDVRTVIDVLDS